VLYVGVTNDLQRRTFEHKNKQTEGFSKKYNLSKLIYFEATPNIDDAIAREKQLKGWRRKKKAELISENNPDWEDLYNKNFK
jgi:putative endonuclease